MAKNYIKGASYLLYLNTGSYGSPSWALINAVGDVTVDPAPDDVEVPERGIGMGHLQGEFNPSFAFTLFEDTGDSNVATMVAAIYSGALTELAVANGPIATGGTKWFRMECVLTAPLSANRGDPASWDVTAYRHANSDYDLTRNTT